VGAAAPLTYTPDPPMRGSTHRDYKKNTYDDDGNYTYCQQEVYRFNFGKCKVPAKVAKIIHMQN
jgi:hypothetical protein